MMEFIKNNKIKVAVITLASIMSLSLFRLVLCLDLILIAIVLLDDNDIT